MKYESDNNLEWLAFCYVADELDADERQQFEQRLSEDQSARDAVANAVSLSQFVYAAHRETELSNNISASLVRDPSAVYRQQRIQAGFMFAASILMALLTVGYFWIFMDQDNNYTLSESTTDSDSLVLAWADSLEQDYVDDLFGEDEETEDSFFYDEDFDSQPAAWMIEAFDETEPAAENLDGES